MDESTIQYLPFHAINEFMLDEYRYVVLEKVLSNLNSLSAQRKGRINSYIRQNVTITGFRNSANAPLRLKMKEAVNLYKKSPEFVAQILGAWCELSQGLDQMVYELLASRGWELLPFEVDRSTQMGFLTNWNKEETYDVLDEAFSQMYPDQSEISVDDIRLMIVWISGRLPYELFEGEEEEEESDFE